LAKKRKTNVAIIPGKGKATETDGNIIVELVTAGACVKEV